MHIFTIQDAEQDFLMLHYILNLQTMEQTLGRKMEKKRSANMTYPQCVCLTRVKVVRVVQVSESRKK